MTAPHLFEDHFDDPVLDTGVWVPHSRASVGERVVLDRGTFRLRAP